MVVLVSWKVKNFNLKFLQWKVLNKIIKLNIKFCIKKYQIVFKFEKKNPNSLKWLYNGVHYSEEVFRTFRTSRTSEHCNSRLTF